MNTTPALPITETKPKMNVEIARLVLEQALEAEKKDKAAEMAHKRALNAHTGASVLLPAEVIVTAATAAPEQESGS